METSKADYSNPFMFDKCYPGYDLGDYNAEEVYEMGVKAGLISAEEKTKAERERLLALIGEDEQPQGEESPLVVFQRNKFRAELREALGATSEK